MLEVGGQAAEGSGIEARSGDFSVIRMGSRGTFVFCTDAPGSML